MHRQESEVPERRVEEVGHRRLRSDGRSKRPLEVMVEGPFEKGGLTVPVKPNVLHEVEPRHRDSFVEHGTPPANSMA